jgi:hypothetical protein
MQQKEANFMKSIEIYINKNDIIHFYEAIKPSSKKKLVPSSVKLSIVINADINGAANRVNGEAALLSRLNQRSTLEEGFDLMSRDSSST